jgi:predicted kinase
MLKPCVYIFRGAPASGKGTIVSEFCKVLPQPVALIEQDKFRWGVHLIGRNVPDVKDQEHALAHRNTVLIYEQYLRDGQYNIVLEGLFTWDNATSSQGNVRELIELAKRYGYPCQSIVLKADKAELLRRNAKRQYSVPQDEFDTLYANVYNRVDSSELVIDSTNQKVDETLRRLKEDFGL